MSSTQIIESSDVNQSQKVADTQAMQILQSQDKQNLALLLLMAQIKQKGLSGSDLKDLQSQVNENYGSDDNDNSNDDSNGITLNMNQNIFLLLTQVYQNYKKVNNTQKSMVLSKETEAQKEYQTAVTKWNDDQKTANKKAEGISKTTHPLTFMGVIDTLEYCAVSIFDKSSKTMESYSNKIKKDEKTTTVDQGKQSSWQDYETTTVGQDQQNAQQSLQNTNSIMQTDFDPKQQNDQMAENIINSVLSWYGQQVSSQ